VPYYSSKAAVIALSESLALQLAPEILVNAIAPGPILEPPGLTPEESMEVIKAIRDRAVLGEIAKTVLR
jgi:NAD(P)-dependent dehydrogenase (short-subunit alcohol dehydrogenase family)